MGRATVQAARSPSHAMHDASNASGMRVDSPSSDSAPHCWAQRNRNRQAVPPFAWLVIEQSALCRSMYERPATRNRRELEPEGRGWNVDRREGGMDDCRLVVAANKADLLPPQATQQRLEVRSFLPP